MTLYIANTFPATAKTTFLSTKVTLSRPFSLVPKPCVHLLFNLNEASLYREPFVLAEAAHPWGALSVMLWSVILSWSKRPRTKSQSAFQSHSVFIQALRFLQEVPRISSGASHSTPEAKSWNTILFKVCHVLNSVRNIKDESILSRLAQVYFSL